MAPDRLPPLVRAMLRPGFYPHPVEAPVRIVETHISFVLLTGPLAYKVKKPVDLGFLDFSTLERRRHFCREELRLNRRGAPGLYLDVLPIAQTSAGGFELAGRGAVVEYVLKMRQFPGGSLLSYRVDTLGIDDAVRLARAVADYHAGARTDETIARFGLPEAVQAAIEQNFRQTEEFAGEGLPQTREQFEQTREFTRHFMRDNDRVFRERVGGGHVRECHGDLHLDNICDWDGRLLLFDCIEFNEAFRNVDTAYDVAFTAMDLESSARADLAATFLNEYLERTGDWEAGRVLPLYLCRQAYVRGKVASFRAEQPAPNDATRQNILDKAARYYRLAWEYGERFGPTGRGRIVLMSGLSGSGKSTIARALARRLGTGAVHVRSDAVRKHLAGVPLDERAGPGVYSEEMTSRTYERLLEIGLSLAAAGFTAVLDAKYDRAARRAAAITAAASRNLPLRIISCEAPQAVLRQRLTERRGDVADATAELLEAQQSSAEAFTDAERPLVLTVEANRHPNGVARQIMIELGDPGR